MAAQEQERYTNDIIDILLSQGLVEEDEKEAFRRYVRGW